jgi:hypothetical protein
VLPCLWPGVRRTASGLPLPSQIRCTLVDSPLRLHPNASSSSLKSPFRAFFTDSLPGPRDVLVGATCRVVHTLTSHSTSPTASLSVCACSSNRSQVPSRLQWLAAIEAGLPGSVAFGQVAPESAGAELLWDAAYGGVVISQPAAFPPVFG